MKRKDSPVKTYRDYLEESANRGNIDAIEAIKVLDRKERYTELCPYIKIIGVNIKRTQWKKKEKQIPMEQTQ